MARPAAATLLAVLLLVPVSARSQSLPLEQRIQVRRDTAMFTVWSWITLADTTGDRSAWLPARRYVRQRLEQMLPPAYVDTLRAAWLAHEDRMFGYHATLLALHLTPPPALDYAPELLQAYAAGGGNAEYLAYLRRLGDPLLPLLRGFYQRALIPEIMAECARWYDPAIAAHAYGTLSAVRHALAYLRMDESAFAGSHRVVIIPNLIGPPGTAIGPSIGGTLFDVESPRAEQQERGFTAHEYIHQLVAPFTKAPEYRARIEAVVTALHDRISGSQAQQYYPDAVAYFDDSLVRALDFSIRRGPELGYDNERLKQELAYQHGIGFVLVYSMCDALATFEQGREPFAVFFPRLLAAVEQATSPPADTRPRYDLVLRVHPVAERMEADVAITFRAPAEGVRQLEYLLNAGLRIEEVSSSIGAVQVSRDTTRRGEYRYAPTAEPVRLTLAAPLPAGDSITIRFRYSGGVRPDSWGTNRITPSWTELGLYSAWFPLQPERRFRYRLALHYPPGYSAAAAGAAWVEETRDADVTTATGVTVVSRETEPVSARSAITPAGNAGARLHATQWTPVKDIPLVLAPGLVHDSVLAQGATIHLRHTGLDEAQRAGIARETTGTLATFREWFGASAGGSLELVFAPRNRGGGYARPGFVVLQHDSRLDVASSGFARYLAHELAHLWWYRATSDSWEDWLNESFAEYAAVRLLRQRLEAEEWRALRLSYAEAAADAPSIRGLDRNHESAYQALYRRGPLILLALEERVGEETMLTLLRAMQRDEVATTAALLTLLERTASPVDRAWLEEALR